MNWRVSPRSRRSTSIARPVSSTRSATRRRDSSRTAPRRRTSQIGCTMNCQGSARSSPASAGSACQRGSTSTSGPSWTSSRRRQRRAAHGHPRPWGLPGLQGRRAPARGSGELVPLPRLGGRPHRHGVARRTRHRLHSRRGCSLDVVGAEQAHQPGVAKRCGTLGPQRAQVMRDALALTLCA